MTKESLHSHAVEREKGYNPYISLVREAWHLARKHNGWTKKETEERYRWYHDYCLENIQDYKTCSVNDQRLLLCLGVLMQINQDTPENRESKPLNPMVI